MNKEPVGLYIFRLILTIGLFAFMCMLYWSSVLIENDMRNLKSEIAGIRSDIDQISQRNPQNLTINESTLVKPSIVANAARPHIDPSLPNLLEEDPFYKNTLPKMLGAGFKAHGVFHDATIGKPDDLHPFSNWSEVSTWEGMCGLSLAKMAFGKYETYTPNMAIKIEARMRKDIAVPEYWVHLRDNVFWQPLNEKMFAGKVKLAPDFLRKHKVTAHDFKFNFDAVMNPFVQKTGAVSLRNYLSDIEKIEVIDDLTLIVRWRARDVVDDNGKTVPKIKYTAKMWTGGLTPLPGFVYKYFADGTKIIDDDADPETYRTNSVWAQNFSEHWAKNIIVSCGPWVFDELTDDQISFHRNPDHFSPLECLAQGSIYEFKNTPDNIWKEFQTNKLDNYILIPSQIVELSNFLKTDLYKEQEKAGNAIKKLEYNNRAFAYIGWNMVRPYFKSEKIRQAMTMAIDRNRIIKQYLNGMGEQITGPFSPYSTAYDKKIQPWPFDPHLARQLLEQEGWYDSDGDGIIDRVIDGKKIPFEFKLTYFVKNPTTKAICEYVTTALKEIGVRCVLNGVDMADLSASFDDKGFDALCMAWMLGTPPEDPRQIWHSEGAKEPGSSNAVGFVNPEADQIIEKLAFEDNNEQRTKLYHRFHEILHEEQPYTFLYMPKVTLLYREYVQNVFIPAERQDLIPGANVESPISSVFWIKEQKG